MFVLFRIFNSLFKKKMYFLYVPLYFLYKRFFERKEIAYFRKIIKEGDVIIDGGANIGFYTDLFSELVGENGIVVSIEPDLINFNLLCVRYGNRKNIIPINAALSDKTGVMNLYLSSDLNVDHRVYKTDENRDFVSVKAYSLDDLLDEIQIKKVRLIKTDFQGYDPVAIRGMLKTIKNNSAHLVLFSEFWPSGMRQVGVNPDEWLVEMSKLGFHYKLLDNPEQAVNDHFYTTLIMSHSNEVLLNFQ
ncbi:FkbM family methyltransferase [Leptospira bandrabouensis]|uniref:FkbM family methyltransferase n=1 Tax=Leptospira bandrabouensis TaxID=2484903 RepID=A0A6H3NSH2_9LEPT|nr:FkbM family methyltransferase [Leptospira bandrabouensis]MCG6152918.1 FkbM family methyltransferase [Leptospira bandrabouensis]TGN03722.1 FkbM family methyltransferase [Leptospira bandrabouensis]TGN12253.1 FkbM family methyltransferase [Leptospira bandrabouensis]